MNIGDTFIDGDNLVEIIEIRHINGKPQYRCNIGVHVCSNWYDENLNFVETDSWVK